MTAQPAAARDARAVAAEAVRRVIDDAGYSTIVVPSLLRRSGLDSRDRSFAAELAYGTLRRRIPIDRTIEERAGRPLERISTSARHLLRIGIYQLVFGAVAPHAAVHETVGLAGPRERGFVNAVLRSVSSEPPAPPGGDSIEDVSVRTGMSPWGVEEIGRVLGGDPEVAAAALATHGSLCLRVNRCVSTVEEVTESFQAAGLSPRPAGLDSDCLLLDGGDPTSFPGWDEGAFAVQDQASAVVVRALGVRTGDRVLDACAGPGGKTAFASCLAGPSLVVAADLRLPRAQLVRRSADRLRVHPLVLVQDGEHPALRGSFDRVLVDAPCSGIGSARRRPELLWRVRQGDLSALARTQVRIVSAAADLVAPGGRLVYAVCTFTRAETDAACDAILRRRPDLAAEPVTVAGRPAVERLRLWPHLDGSDGMFVAAFRRS